MELGPRVYFCHRSPTSLPRPPPPTSLWESPSRRLVEIPTLPPGPLPLGSPPTAHPQARSVALALAAHSPGLTQPLLSQHFLRLGSESVSLGTPARTQPRCDPVSPLPGFPLPGVRVCLPLPHLDSCAVSGRAQPGAWESSSCLWWCYCVAQRSSSRQCWNWVPGGDCRNGTLVLVPCPGLLSLPERDRRQDRPGLLQPPGFCPRRKEGRLGYGVLESKNVLSASSSF